MLPRLSRKAQIFILSVLILLISSLLAFTVVLQILQMHSWLKGLADFVSRCTTLDLVEDPVQQPFPVGLAYLLPGLTERKVFPPEATMGGSHLVQELVKAQAQGPEADDATRRAYLVVVTAHQFLEVGKQNFNGPPLSHVADHLLQGIIKPGRRPVPGVLQVRMGVWLHDEHLAGAKSAHPGFDKMGIHHL